MDKNRSNRVGTSFITMLNAIRCASLVAFYPEFLHNLPELWPDDQGAIRVEPVVVVIILVIFFCRVEFGELHDLGCYGIFILQPYAFYVLVYYPFVGILLIEYYGPVLLSNIFALPVL